MINYPCKNCTKRKLGCHGTCEEYKKMKEENERIAEMRRKEINYNGYCVLRLERIARIRGKKMGENLRVIA